MNNDYSLNCSDHILLEAFKERNLDYSMLLSGSWGFCYLNEKQLPIWDRIMPYDNKSRRYAFQSHGIKITTINPRLNDALNIIKTQLKNRCIVIISIDTFYCKWHKGYYKSHYKHHVSVIGISHELMALICNDPFLDQYNVLLNFCEYEKGMSEIKVYELNEDERKFEQTEVIETILNAVQKSAGMFNMIKDFARGLAVLKRWDELFDYRDDIYLCSLPRVLKFVIDARSNMGVLMKEQGNLSAPFQKKFLLISNSFFALAARWEKVNNTIMKVYFKQTFNAEMIGKIANKLYSISETEYEIYREMEDLLSQMKLLVGE